MNQKTLSACSRRASSCFFSLYRSSYGGVEGGLVSRNGACRVHGHSQEVLPTSASAANGASPMAARRISGGGGRSKRYRSPAAGDGWSSPANQHLNDVDGVNNLADCCPNGGHRLCPEVSKALSGVMLIAEQKKRMEESTKVRQPTLLRAQSPSDLFALSLLRSILSLSLSFPRTPWRGWQLGSRECLSAPTPTVARTASTPASQCRGGPCLPAAAQMSLLPSLLFSSGRGLRMRGRCGKGSLFFPGVFPPSRLAGKGKEERRKANFKR